MTQDQKEFDLGNNVKLIMKPHSDLGLFLNCNELNNMLGIEAMVQLTPDVEPSRLLVISNGNARGHNAIIGYLKRIGIDTDPHHGEIVKHVENFFDEVQNPHPNQVEVDLGDGKLIIRPSLDQNYTYSAPLFKDQNALEISERSAH